MNIIKSRPPASNASRSAAGFLKKEWKMSHQKLLQQVFAITLIVILVGCNSPAITLIPVTPTTDPPTVTPLSPTPTTIPLTITPLPPTPSPLPLTQTPLPPSMNIQEGNKFPRTLLQPKPSGELADNHIGSLCHPPWCVRDEVHINDEFFDLGLKGN
jgi:hypothetical protein